MSEVVPNHLTLQVGEFYNLKLCADSADSKITDSSFCWFNHSACCDSLESLRKRSMVRALPHWMQKLNSETILLSLLNTRCGGDLSWLPPQLLHIFYLYLKKNPKTTKQQHFIAPLQLRKALPLLMRMRTPRPQRTPLHFCFHGLPSCMGAMVQWFVFMKRWYHPMLISGVFSAMLVKYATKL